MPVTIEFTTGSFEYQVLKGNADFDERFEDNEKVQGLVERLHNSRTYEEREEIADELWGECGYDNAARMLHPEGRLQVTYTKSDEDAINDGAYEILDCDWVDFDDFFEEDVKKSSFCIVKNSFAKRAHFYLKTELDEPFSGEFFKISDGDISYKGEALEFTGDAGGWIEDNRIYVFGSSSIEEEDEKIQNAIDKSQTLWQTARDKFSELLMTEINDYQIRRDDLRKWESSEMFAAWKEAGIPDNGETNWEDLELETQNYTFKFSDEARLEKMEEKGMTDSQQYNDLKELQSKTKTWETRKDLIEKKYRVTSYSHNDPQTWEVVDKYKDCQDIDMIYKWGQSTRDRVLEMQSKVDALKKERDEMKMQRHTSFGYGVSGAYWDSTLEKSVGWKSDEWFAVALDYHFHIEEYMASIGKGDTVLWGKDSEENTRRIKEWNDAMNEIDRDYDRKIDSIIDSIDY